MHYRDVTITIPLHWLRGRGLAPADHRQALLRRVLQSAVTQTRYARDYDRDIGRMEQLPWVDLLEFLCHPERYSVEKAGTAPRTALHYPLGTAPRTAVVGRRVEESRRVRVFESLHDERLRSFAPQALAAPLDAFRAVGGEARCHGPLRNAVLVFSGILEGPLTPEDADALWRRYQVPVFEQFLGFDGELLAWECEIHHGLHVRESAAYFEAVDMERLVVSFLANPRLPLLRLETGLTGRLVTDACPCGEPSPRLVDLRRRTVRRVGGVGSVAMAAVR